MFCFIGYPRGPFSGDFFKFGTMTHRKKGRKYRRIAGLILLPMVVLAVIWVYLRWPESPSEELRAANQAIATAREAEAEKYAPAQLAEIVQLYDSAMQAWKIENERFLLNRDFTRTILFARRAVEKGFETYEKATAKAVSVNHTTAATLEELEKIVETFKKVYSPLPLRKSLRENFNRASLIISEAKLSREKSDFHIAEAKLEKARKILESADREAGDLLRNYFAAYPRWKELVDDAIAQSASRRSTLLVVDKMAHELRTYQGGKLTHTYPAEFGPNWIGDKQHKGDQATPEGMYQVTQKKERRKTIYHKALLLNYPNEEDRARYRKNMDAGKYPSRTEIGGLIEIHGHGGRDFDWTNGCVALSNKDMDAVYRIAGEKTPVVIVGSTIPLEAYLEKLKTNEKK